MIMKVSSQAVRKILWILLSLFLLMNLSAIFHAYRFTHFDPSQEETTERPDQLSFWEKVEVLFLGIKNPRPVNTKKPKGKYKTITLDDKSPALESWSIPSQEGSRGIVLMFHGYKASKSSLLDKSKVLREMGYRTVLVDLMGSGGSEGNTTTLGHFEAQQVQRCSEHWEEKEDGPQRPFDGSARDHIGIPLWILASDHLGPLS